jgi:hypothetical protein
MPFLPEKFKETVAGWYISLGVERKRPAEGEVAEVAGGVAVDIVHGCIRLPSLLWPRIRLVGCIGN